MKCIRHFETDKVFYTSDNKAKELVASRQYEYITSKYKRPNTDLKHNKGHLKKEGGKRFRYHYYLVRVISNIKVTKVVETQLDRKNPDMEVVELEDYEKMLEDLKLQCWVKAKQKGIACTQMQIKKPSTNGEDIIYIAEEKEGGKIKTSKTLTSLKEATCWYFGIIEKK